MRSNLKTVLSAYTRVTSEVLDGYVTEAPADGNTYGRKDKQWVQLSDESDYFTFTVGGLDKEKIEVNDLTNLGQALNPTSSKFDVSFDLKTDSYVWFCSTKAVDYIAQVGGLEIDYETTPIELIKTTGNKSTKWYCYRSTQQLLSGHWNLTIKLSGGDN